MPSSISDFLKSLWKPPTDRSFGPGDDLDQYNQKWGFTLYRTFYGPGSEEQWCRLLQNMTTGAEYELSVMDEAGDDPISTAKLWDLFQLDARSDPDTLDGLTLEDVRQQYLDGAGGKPMNADNGPWRVFFIADAQVLRDPDVRVIKAVAADYDPVRAVPKNNWCGPQRYFGWITMPSGRILDLWLLLETYFFKDLGNHTAGGPGAWWDPDEY